MSKKINIHKILVCTTYFYLVLPFLIFLLGWCRMEIAIPATILIFTAVLCVTKDADYSERSDILDAKKWIIILGILSALVILSGIGRMAYTNWGEQYARDSLFEVLANNKWPVVGEVLVDGKPELRMFTYYFGFWLPSALIGKVFGITAGYIAQFAWAVFGMLLMYYHICIWRRKTEIWPLIIFIFFSGIDFAYYYLFNLPVDKNLWDVTSLMGYGSYYHSTLIMMNGIYNQAIPAWLATIFLWSQRKKEGSWGLILSSIMLPATFSFVGLLPIAIYGIVMKLKKCYKEGEVLKGFLKLFTFPNLVGVIVIGGISFLFLTGNISSVNKGITGGSVATTEIIEDALISHLPIQMIGYIVCIVMEVGIYFYLIYDKYKHNLLYKLILGILLVCPWIKIGYSNDFRWDASVPALFILVLLIINYFEKTDWNHWKKRILTAILIISGLGMLPLIKVPFYAEKQGYTHIAQLNREQILLGSNFSAPVDTYFSKYVAEKNLIYKQEQFENMEIDYCNLTPTTVEYQVEGNEFSEEQNALFTDEIRIIFYAAISTDVEIYLAGMLDDIPISATISVDGVTIGNVDYDSPSVVVSQETFNQYAHEIKIKISRETKLYEQDRIYLIKADNIRN